MNILEITNQVRTTDDSIAFLRQRGIFRALGYPPMCPVCAQAMQIRQRESRGDGEVWRCERRVGGAKHKRQMSIRYGFDSFYFENFSAIGSFLDNSKLTPWKFIMLAYFWVHGSSAQERQNFCDVNKDTVTDWNNFPGNLFTSSSCKPNSSGWPGKDRRNW